MSETIRPIRRPARRPEVPMPTRPEEAGNATPAEQSAPTSQPEPVLQQGASNLPVVWVLASGSRLGSQYYSASGECDNCGVSPRIGILRGVTREDAAVALRYVACLRCGCLSLQLRPLEESRPSLTGPWVPADLRNDPFWSPTDRRPPADGFRPQPQQLPLRPLRPNGPVYHNSWGPSHWQSAAPVFYLSADSVIPDSPPGPPEADPEPQAASDNPVTAAIGKVIAAREALQQYAAETMRATDGYTDLLRGYVAAATTHTDPVSSEAPQSQSDD